MVQSWNITASGKVDENSISHICSADDLGDVGSGADAGPSSKMVRAVHRSATGGGASYGDAQS